MPGRMRKALGSIKDTTTISLAKLNSDHKDLDIAIIKATNHAEDPIKERHMQAIFAALSSTQARDDVIYGLHALTKRLAKTCNWAVALKTLIVIHRALMEVDSTFRDLLVSYARSRNRVFSMSHFRDDSSANAWDYSSWVRCYSAYLEEKLVCYCYLKYDLGAEKPRTRNLGTVDLLEQLPVLQQLLYRVIRCRPIGASTHNHVIQSALHLVACESIKIYNAINDAIANLVCKFFKLRRRDAVWALDIYKRAGQQADRLWEFYESCKILDVCHGENFVEINKQPPPSVLQAMEEYARDPYKRLSLPKEQVKAVTEEGKESLKTQKKAVVPETLMLLDLDDPPQAEKNAKALTTIPIADQSTIAKQENWAAEWDLVPVATPSANQPAKTPCIPTGGLNNQKPYDRYSNNNNNNNYISRRTRRPVSHNPASMIAPNGTDFIRHPQPQAGSQIGGSYGANAHATGMPLKANNPFSSLLM